MAPPIRLASRLSSSTGPRMRRSRTREPKPGRELLEPGLHPVGEALEVVVVPLAADALVAGVAAGPLRDVGVGPHRLGAGRRAGRVGGGHLAGEHERPGRDQAGGDLAERLGHVGDAVGDVQGAGRLGRRALPGHRPAQRPVDLDRGRVELEGAHAPADPVGHVGRGQQVGVQAGSDDASPPRPVRRPNVSPSVVCTVRARPPDGADPLDRPPSSGSRRPCDRSRRARAWVSMPGAALGDREADGLPHHAHQQRHQARARRVEGDVGVPGVARQQQPRSLAAEPVPAEVETRA